MTDPKKSSGKGDDPLASALVAAQTKDLQEEIERLKAEAEEGALLLQTLQADGDRWKDVAARAQADLQNAKSRMEKDRAELGKFAAEGVIVRLLPTLDHFQRAFTQIPKDIATHEWVKGVQAIEQDLMKQMADLGLKRMQSLGQQLDPARHEALMTGQGEEGKILEAFEDGYELHGKILRHAKVKVGEGPLRERQT